MKTYEELVKEYRKRQHDTVVDTIATGLSYVDQIAVDTGLLEETGILTELTQKNDELCFVLWQKAPIDPDKVGPFMQRYQRRLRFVAGDKPHFAYILPAGGGGICDVLGEAEHLIDDMQQELLASG